jgi:multidrug efflux system membrane fusion protein
MEGKMNKTADSLILSLMFLFLLPAPLWAKEIDAALRWSRKVELSAPVSGIVSEVAANTGEHVSKGQPLLRLDDRPFKAEAEKAKAEVKRLEVKLHESEQEFKRAKEMHERELLADHELELAKSGFLTSESEFKSAQASLTKAELDLEYSVVRAPFDGIILNRTVEVGQTIISAMQPAPMFIIAEAGYMIARVKIPYKELSTLSPGQKVHVTVSGKKYEGSISFIGMEPVETKERSYLYEVNIRFSVGPSIMRPGQEAAVTLP